MRLTLQEATDRINATLKKMQRVDVVAKTINSIDDYETIFCSRGKSKTYRLSFEAVEDDPDLSLLEARLERIVTEFDSAGGSGC